ncbi:MAG: transaldolase [Anaerolineales bacterium]|jgi:transaldolase
MNNIQKLAELGQSIWLDNIHRKMLESGELKGLTELGVLGVTSNPSIFEKAIAGSADYDEQLKMLTQEDASTNEIYEALVLRDIGMAADILRPVYERTDGLDGYVSLEVSPELANETKQTVEEAKRFFDLLRRPNIMIKVPATDAGIPAIEELIAAGVNINVTLIFAISNYEKVAGAYIQGLERALQEGKDIHRIASVASFFVSRVDTAVDAALDQIDNHALQGELAVANAKLAYRRFNEIFSGSDWDRLASAGARVQRPLWASTSTKNPAYSDILYVAELIGSSTVNTVPPSTLESFLDHGNAVLTLETNVDQAREQLEQVRSLGIDFGAITSKLQHDGVEAFAKSYRNLIAAIDEKCKQMKVQAA